MIPQILTITPQSERDGEQIGILATIIKYFYLI